eukprot:616890_1
MAAGQLLHMILSLIIMWVILLPVFILFITRTYRARHSILMSKRYINGSLCCCIFLLLWLMLNRSLELIRAYLFIHGYARYRSFIIFYCLEQMVYPLCAHGGVYALLYRFWMIYFDFIFSESLENQQWKIQINPTGSSYKEQWIIEHRKDYGNPKWIAIRCAVAYVVVALFSATLRLLGPLGLFDPNTASTIDSGLYLMPLVSIFVLWIKIPAWKDSFLVKDELKWIVFIYAIALCGNLTLVIFFKINPDFNMYWNEALWVVVVLLTCSSLIFMQTQYIFVQIRRDAVYFRHIFSAIAVADHSVYEVSMDSAASTPTSPSTPSSPRSSSHANHMRLCDMLGNKAAWNLFMHHISTEFSTECIFSFIEFTQFRLLLEADETFMAQIKQYTTVNVHAEPSLSPSKTPKLKRKKNTDSYENVVLLDEETVPLSYIVYEKQYGEESMTKMDKYKCIVIALAEKYIYDSGDFCINIHYKTRCRLVDWIHVNCYDKDKDFEGAQFCEMYDLFERCREEMYKLMQYSFSRFVRTDPFRSLNRNT